MKVSNTLGIVIYGLLRSQQMTYVTYASIFEYVIKKNIPKDIVFSVDGDSSWLPQTFNISSKSRFLEIKKYNVTDSYIHAMNHVLYGLNALKVCTIIVVSRVDVEYASYLSIKYPVHLNTVFIPTFQNYGQLNDRFCYGRKYTVLKWFQVRLELARKSIYAEKGACIAAKKIKLNISHMDLKFVRRRKDMFVPDIDKATVWNTINIRQWMIHHKKSC
jgi:hypothetical protein